MVDVFGNDRILFFPLSTTVDDPIRRPNPNFYRPPLRTKSSTQDREILALLFTHSKVSANILREEKEKSQGTDARS